MTETPRLVLDGLAAKPPGAHRAVHKVHVRAEAAAARVAHHHAALDAQGHAEDVDGGHAGCELRSCPNIACLMMGQEAGALPEYIGTRAGLHAWAAI